MTTSESFDALRRANPRAKAGFAQSVEATRDLVRERIAVVPTDVGEFAAPPGCRAARAHPRRRLVGVSAAGVSLATAVAVALVLTLGSTGGPGVEEAAAAVEKAGLVTAASADRSGTATVRITHAGELWASKTVRWNGEDVQIGGDTTPSPLLVVGGTMYARDPGDGQWVSLGDPDSIDPDSGTTPAEYLAAVREDVGGTTFRRITAGMADPASPTWPRASPSTRAASPRA